MLKSYLWGSIVLVSSSSLAAQSTCQIDLKKFPPCHPSSNIVPSHYPPAFYYPPQEGNLLAILEGLDGTPTQLIISKYALEEFKKKLKSQTEIARLESLILKRAIVENPPQITSETQVPEKTNTAKMLFARNEYQRDFTTFSYDPSSRQITSYQTESALPQKKEEFSFCGIAAKIDTFEAEDNGDAGGNILGLPFGICLTGETANLPLRRKQCGPKSQIVALKTPYTTVNHIDETMGIIPGKGKPPCDFSITFASTQRFLEVLKRNPDKPFFDPEEYKAIKKGEEENNCDGGDCKALSSSICSALASAELLSQVDRMILNSEKMENPKANSGSATSWILPTLFGLIEPTYAGIKANKGDPKESKFPQFYELVDQFNPKPCEERTNRSVLEALTTKNPNSLSRVRAWLEKNRDERENIIFDISTRLSELDQLASDALLFDQVQNENWNKISESIAGRCPIESMKVEVPHLVFRKAAVSPGPTNGVAIGSNYIYPKQISSALAEDVESQIKKFSPLNPLPQNVYKYHSGGGAVHCISNEIRVCSPGMVQ